MDTRDPVEVIRSALSILPEPTTPEELRDQVGLDKGVFDGALDDAFSRRFVFRVGSGLLGSADHLHQAREIALNHLSD